MRTEILFSAPLITRSLVPWDQAACPVWDRKLVKAAVFHHISQMDAGGTTLLGSPLANFHLELQGRERSVCLSSPSESGKKRSFMASIFEQLKEKSLPTGITTDADCVITKVS